MAEYNDKNDHDSSNEAKEIDEDFVTHHKLKTKKGTVQTYWCK